MTEHSEIAARYRRFADEQAAGISPSFQRWAQHVAQSGQILDRLAELPEGKQQPNLVFAAARVHGAQPGDTGDLDAVFIERWDDVRRTVLARSTQTNEPARCAALLLALQEIAGPIALLELGASAGLNLVPDRYGYDFGRGRRLDPATGPSSLTIDVDFGEVDTPARMPEIVWRAGMDLNPLDPGDPDTVEWLRALVWPEQTHRLDRLTKACAIAAAEKLDVRRGDIVTGTKEITSQAPKSATLVVLHTAVLAYLDEPSRREVVAAVHDLGARRFSYEGRGVDPTVPEISAPVTPETFFVAALDGAPLAVGDGHCSALHPVPSA